MSISILNRGASGGLKPELTVTAPSGSTIDLLQNGIIVATYTLGANETERTFTVRVGTYTVRGTLGVDTEETETVIDSVGQFYVVMRFINPVFANNTWAKIIEACETDEVPETWLVGNQKTMVIDGTEYLLDIIAKGWDPRSDGNGNAALTLQLHGLYKNSSQMHTTYYNKWADCYMRKTVLPSIMATMPSEVQAAIKSVSKLTSIEGMNCALAYNTEKLFLLSEFEVFGKNKLNSQQEGAQYPYYANGNSTAKGADWWLRSPDSTTSNANANYCYANESTRASSCSAAPNYKGVSFAFCL